MDKKGKTVSTAYKGANVKGGKYSGDKNRSGREVNGSFSGPPAYTGTHRKSTGAPRYTHSHRMD